MSTIRRLISIATSRKWRLNQLDVNNTFLHGDLKEKDYMQFPPGFLVLQTMLVGFTNHYMA